MPKLIDLDQYITVPITDDHGEYTVEITVGEFFKRFLPGEQLKVVDAIPVEWFKNRRDIYLKAYHAGHESELHTAAILNDTLKAWQKEQGAR